MAPLNWRRVRAWLPTVVMGVLTVGLISGAVIARAAGGAAAPGASSTAGLPASLQAEIAANDAAGLPGLDNGVTVPAGCDIRTSLDPNGRARIEAERTAHRLMNVGQTAAFIAAGNAQLQAYLQVAVRDYCSQEGTGGPTGSTGTGVAAEPSPATSTPAADPGTPPGQGVPSAGAPGPSASASASGDPAGTAGLPASLQAEIAANDAAGLPGLDNGVTVPAGCDIRTSLDPNGRARIEQERTVHRLMNVGQTAAWIAAANAQLQAYLQVAVRDYCSQEG